MTDSAEFKEAQALQDAGKLFENYTDKKSANSAEKHLQARFEDLFDDGQAEVEAAEAEQAEAEQAEPALRDPEQAEIFAALRAQGQAHQQSHFNATLAQAGPAT